MLERALVDVEASTVEDLAPAVRVLDAREAKGLEFDHVVLAEPAAMVEEVEGVQGWRHLYVALTRATKTLTVVHARPLSLGLAVGAFADLGVDCAGAPYAKISASASESFIHLNGPLPGSTTTSVPCGAS